MLRVREVCYMTLYSGLDDSTIAVSLKVTGFVDSLLIMERCQVRMIGSKMLFVSRKGGLKTRPFNIRSIRRNKRG